jgi:hypothetical protein
LRSIRAIVTDAVAALDAKIRATLERTEHALTALKGLLQAWLPRAFCYLRTERNFADRFDYEVLFRWFAGLGVGAQFRGLSTSPK